MNTKTGTNHLIAAYARRAVAMLFGIFLFGIILLPGCGSSGGMHQAAPQAAVAARVTGMVIMQTTYTNLAREEAVPAGQATPRQAAQGAVISCGAVPAGWVAVSNATVTVTGEDTTSATDSNGCFSMDLRSTGLKVFTVRKTNSKGGVTILKKAASVTSGADLRFTDTECIELVSTAAALVVENQMESGTDEDSIDVDAINTFFSQNQTETNVAALVSAVAKSADPDETDVSNFDSIPEALITTAAQQITRPVISSPSVSWNGNQVTISATVTDDGSVAAVTATLTPASGGTAIPVALTSTGSGGTYSGTYTFAAALDTSYSIVISSTDDQGNTYTYTGGSGGNGALVSSPAAFCGDGRQDAGEACDDGNAVTETCAYGQTSCTVCNATCQSVAGAVTGYCGDGTTNTGNGEACDDGNTTTESCAYGQATCTVCNATCQSVAGATSACGDGTTDAAAGETCDDGNTTTESCAYGQANCTVCNATCQSVTGATSTCGDGTTDAAAGETCDDSNTTTESCAYGQTSCIVCNATCQSAAGTVVGYCGDGSVDGGNGETCDDGANNGTLGFCNSACNGETLDEYTMVVNGGYHSCGILSSTGGVRCWGRNDFGGELGDGTTTSRSKPVDVVGLTSGVQSVAAGFLHTCALTTGGGVKCWGYNGDGELGNGSLVDSPTPVDVSGLTSGVQAISTTTGYHTCALTTGGGVKCWGGNTFYGLGDGTNTNRSTPVNVTGLAAGVQSISAGKYHSCAVTTAGGAKCWGWNTYGTLGDGTTTYRSSPVDVTGLTSGVQSISAGESHTCAVTTAGGAKCWGWNNSGRLGDGTTTNSTSPVDVSGMTSGVQQILAGGSHTCALTTAGGVKCWGINSSGQLGIGTTTSSTLPADVTGLSSGVQSVSAGSYSTCVLTTANSAKCWGQNNYGQLGDNSTTQRLTPVNVVVP